VPEGAATGHFRRVSIIEPIRNRTAHDDYAHNRFAIIAGDRELLPLRCPVVAVVLINKGARFFICDWLNL